MWTSNWVSGADLVAFLIAVELVFHRLWFNRNTRAGVFVDTHSCDADDVALTGASSSVDNPEFTRTALIWRQLTRRLRRLRRTNWLAGARIHIQGCRSDAVSIADALALVLINAEVLSGAVLGSEVALRR